MLVYSYIRGLGYATSANPASDAVKRRAPSNKHAAQLKRKRRRITNSAGVDLLELASAALATLPTTHPDSEWSG
jgi:hypothetical protein